MIISGDISLVDANEALSFVADILSSNANIMVSVSYDEEVYEEISMLIIDSK